MGICEISIPITTVTTTYARYMWARMLVIHPYVCGSFWGSAYIDGDLHASIYLF